METSRFGLLSPFVYVVFLLTLFSIQPVYSTQAKTAPSGTESGQTSIEQSASDSNPSPEITPAKDESTSNTAQGGEQDKSGKDKAKEDSPSEMEPGEADKDGVESMALLSGGEEGEAASESGHALSAPESKLFTGSLTYTIPIKVPPGRTGLAPELALVYNSYFKNGPLGVGWNLNLPAIRRSTKRGVDYSANDYVIETGDYVRELVSRSSDWGDNYYGAKIEEEFAQYYYDTVGRQWIATAKNGTKFYYGQAAATRQHCPGNSNQIFRWCLDRIQDTNGNYIIFTYFKDQEQIYLDEIEYTGSIYGLPPSNTIKFHYESRTDVIFDHSSQYQIKTVKRLDNIEIRAKDDDLVRTYDLSYSLGASNRSRLTSCQEVGTDGTSTFPPVGMLDHQTGGDGTFTPASSTINFTPGFDYARYMVDVDGDCRADLIEVKIIPGFPDSYEFLMRRSNGDGTFALMGQVSNLEIIPPVFGDINGDGLSDYIAFGQGGIKVNFGNGDGTPDLITSLMSSRGAIIDITYKPSSEYENNILPFVLPTVAEVTIDDGLVNVNATYYDYQGGHFDGETREFRGFAMASRENPDGTFEKTYFHQGEHLRGRADLKEFYDFEGGSVIKDIDYQWATFPAPPPSGAYAFVKLNWQKTSFYDSTTVFSKEQYTYNNTNGNLTKIVLTGTDANLIDKRYTWWQDGSNWLFRMSRERIYNHDYLIERQTTFTYQPGTGNRLTKNRYLATGANPILSYQYDAYGNLSHEIDALGNPISYVYDPSTYTYPVLITNPLGHVIEKDWDYRFGREKWVEDPNNNRTNFAYDPFGRLKEVSYPDDGHQEIVYEDYEVPRYKKTMVKETYTSTLDKYEYFDGLNRPVQTITYGEGGKLIVTKTYYDEMGRVELVEGPFFVSGVPEYPKATPASNYFFRETFYDELGRVISIITPNDSGGAAGTDYSYSGFTATISDPDGKIKVEKRDHLGRIIQVMEHNNSSVYTTNYAYNAAGDLLSVVDHYGNPTSITYDTLGRKTQMTDPDMGTWNYTYDKNDNLLTQTDAKNQTITFAYDPLNRLLSKNYSSPDDPMFYVYDQSVNGVGRSYSVIRGEAETVYDSYDTMGRPTSITKNIPGDDTARTTTYAYDYAGKVVLTTHPDGYVVANEYYPGTGLLYRVIGWIGDIHARCEDYEPTGKIGKIIHQNGAQTVYTYYGWSTRLKQIVTTRSGTIQNREYFYTEAGDIERIIDHKAGITYDYGYDDLHRLISEYSYGAYPAINYAYNAIGNITSQSIGSTVYSYSYNDPNHKHAVSMINVNSQNHYFTYDANGNMTSGKDLTNLGDIATRTIQWNADNMPVSINHSMHGQTIFTYDGNNTRIKKARGNTETFYFGPEFEIKKQGSSTDYVVYIFAGNLRVAKVSIENGTFYFHKDHLGSSTVITTSSGSVSETTEYRPFGSQRTHTGMEASKYKFTDQELGPESGLYIFFIQVCSK